jgi:hypothetical protein
MALLGRSLGLIAQPFVATGDHKYDAIVYREAMEEREREINPYNMVPSSTNGLSRFASADKNPSE